MVQRRQNKWILKKYKGSKENIYFHTLGVDVLRRDMHSYSSTTKNLYWHIQSIHENILFLVDI